MGGIRLVELTVASDKGNVTSEEAKKDDVQEVEKGPAMGKPRETILTKEMLGPVLKNVRIANEIKVTDNDIANTAKGDGLSKTIFIVQSSWFMVQCITRAAQGLALTELELTTLALASLNGLTLLLWWKKPLGAQTVARVYLQKKLTDDERNDTGERTGGVSPVALHVPSLTYLIQVTVSTVAHTCPSAICVFVASRHSVWVVPQD